MRRGIAAIIAASIGLMPAFAQAFCGFYVTGADARLYANATMVVMMRDGNRTVLSMQNNYQGPPQDFAMVIPVPVVLQRENVKTLERDVFERVDHLAAPRLVEYWEQDPCSPPVEYDRAARRRGGGGIPAPTASAQAMEGAVRIEAQFTVGEYEIVILSASDSMALDTWLRQNRYRIPDGAEAVLRPYVQAGMKFFVAKVNVERVRFQNGQAMLSPLRFHYDSDEFSLPVRLGLLNSSGVQDLIVHILAPNQRYEVANYPNVTIPTNIDVDDGVRERFAEFYAALYDRTVERNARAVVTEYAWQATNCDPCPGPVLSESDLTTLGSDVLPSFGAGTRTSTATVLEARPEGSGLPGDVAQMLVNRQLNQLRGCHQAAMGRNASLGATAEIQLVVDPSGLVSESPRVTGGDTAFASCVAAPMRTLRFPPPDNGARTPVRVRLALNSEEPNPWMAQMRMQQFVLTRLHARYTRDALGQDLVFRPAQPIVGGREHIVDDAGRLEEGSRPDAANNFQARYAIRHTWNGPIACANPRRGIWGGPPGGQPRPGVRPATDLAFVTRGRAQLEQMVKQNVPEIGLVAGAAVQPGSTPRPEPTGTVAPGAQGAPTPVGASPPAATNADDGCEVGGDLDPTGWSFLAIALGTIAFVTRSRRRPR